MKRTALTLLLTALATVSTWAWSGQGTKNDPYVIDNVGDWESLNWYIGTEELRDPYIRAYYKLADNFDNSSRPTSYSLGTDRVPFEGHFDGNGRTLYVNTMVASTEQGAAPFGGVNGATIINLNVVGTVTAGQYHAAGLVGVIKGGTVTIRNCHVSANVVGNGYAGGLVGHGGDGTTLIMENCDYSGTISNCSTFAGGLLGWCDDLNLTMTNCLFKGTFSCPGKVHPIGVKYAPKTVKANVTNTYYLNTITPTVTGNNLIPGAGGAPVSQTRVPGQWTVGVVAADGNTYYRPGTYANATFAEGTKDVEHWSITPESPEDVGSTVTLTYSGGKQVENVKVGTPWDGDLSKLKTNVIVSDGMTLTGRLGPQVKVSIADGATVMLENASITGYSWEGSPWAGINCEGDATIILKGKNYVSGLNGNYPGIHVPVGHTLTILGKGELDAHSSDFGAGIGGGNGVSCGNIRILGGTITAQGGNFAAAIGGGKDSACGDITISTLVGDTTTVEFFKGRFAPYSIGPGESGTCGVITLGGSVSDPIDSNGKIIIEGKSGEYSIPTQPSEKMTMIIPVEVTPGETAGTWFFVMPNCDVEVYVEYAKPTVTFAEGTVDVENWDIAPESPVEDGTNVTLTYSGTRHVESIRAGTPCGSDISAVRTWVTVPDGATLTGKYEHWGKITIADGATITLQDFSNKSWNWAMCTWAGLNCEGDATIILKGNNVVTGYHQNYPGIHVPEGHTLTIRGDGSLNVKSSVYGAGIGGGIEIPCGNIRIEGGTITAQGGSGAAAIGGGRYASCGDITITDGVTSVTVTKSSTSSASIGAGPNGTCGTITIGGNVTEPIVGDYTYTGTGSGSVDTTPETTGNAVPYIAVDLTPGETEGTWTFVMPDRNIEVNVEYSKYNVTFAEDTKDVEHWDVTPKTPSEGSTVTLAYSGNMQVGSVNIAFPWDGDLSTVRTNVMVSDGMTLTGKLNSEVKITIADGAIVTLQDVTIEGKNWNRCTWAGISCEGDATIVLKGTNVVKGFQHYYPGIFVPEGHTLTIRGGGSLQAASNGFGAGIGGGKDIPCGNIRIVGGTVIAQGGDGAAAIGGGENAACGDITITGSIVELSANKESTAPYSIGPGKNGTCGTITIASEVKEPIDFSCAMRGNGTADTSTDPSERITMNTPVEVTPGETAGTWTFVMPNGDVQVSVAYKAHNPADVNRDGTVDVADIATIIDVMAKGTDAFPEYDADVNEDGTVDVADIASVIDVMAANARRQQNAIDDEE
ncbi:MAG: dockerin type I repeat-containing protein [Prevotella sp.]|nr:dockerin type I repeat-containing protein [Prevotella sp.]